MSQEGEGVRTQALRPRPLVSLPGLPFRVCISKPCGREAAAPPGDPPSEPRERRAARLPRWPCPAHHGDGGKAPLTQCSETKVGRVPKPQPAGASEAPCCAADGAQAARTTGHGAGGWRVGLQPQGSLGRDPAKTQTPEHPTLCPPWIWGNAGACSRRPEEGLQPSCLKFKVIKIRTTTRFPQTVTRLLTHSGTARRETPQGESFPRESAVTKTARSLRPHSSHQLPAVCSKKPNGMTAASVSARSFSNSHKDENHVHKVKPERERPKASGPGIDCTFPNACPRAATLRKPGLLGHLAAHFWPRHRPGPPPPRPTGMAAPRPVAWCPEHDGAVLRQFRPKSDPTSHRLSWNDGGRGPGKGWNHTGATADSERASPTFRAVFNIFRCIDFPKERKPSKDVAY